MLSPHFLQTVRKTSWHFALHPGLPPDAMLLGFLADLLTVGLLPLSDVEWQHLEEQVGLRRLAGTSTGV